MQLIGTVLGYIVNRGTRFVAILLLMFFVSATAAWASAKFASATQIASQLSGVQEELAEKVAELDAEKSDYAESLATGMSQWLKDTETDLKAAYEDLGTQVKDQKAKVDRLKEAVCGGFVRFVQDAGGAVGLPEPCAEAEEEFEKGQKKLDSLTQTRATTKRQLDIVQNQDLTQEEKVEQLNTGSEELGDLSAKNNIATLETEIAELEAEEEDLKLKQDPQLQFLLEHWSTHWKWLVGIALILFLTRPLTRCLNYFVAMPLFARYAKPLRLSTDEAANSRARISVGPAERSLQISLAPGEELSARAQYLRDVQGTVRDRLLHDLRSPFLSFAAGLRGLSRVSLKDGVARLTISDPEERNSYLMRVDFQDHPGITMHPRHVVGLIGDPRLKTRWRWGPHFLATGQARYILFTGTGSLLVQGVGDIVAPVPAESESRMEQNLVLGFDTRLTVGIQRSESFFSYWRGLEPLSNRVFSGNYPYFWQKNAAAGAQNPITRAFEVAYSAIGKVLGF